MPTYKGKCTPEHRIHNISIAADRCRVLPERDVFRLSFENRPNDAVDTANDRSYYITRCSYNDILLY
jgi:hypothetical protein